MTINKNYKLFSELVELFLATAKSMNEDNGYDMRVISAAIQYSAARVNELEANSNCDCLGCYRADATDWYTNEYKAMFEKHADCIVEHSCY